MGMLKRTTGGYYTLLPLDQGEDREALCEGCGLESCVMRQVMRRVEVNKYNAIVRVKSCQSFQPILDFRDQAGTAGQFNTFRLGRAWEQRLKRGDIVALRGSDKEIFGKACVKALHSGLFSVLNELYGSDNHSAIAAELAGKDFDLGRVMKNCYGSTRFTEDRVVSVIYLERLND